MAVTLTAVLTGTTMNIQDITSTADADAAATVTHGLGATPLFVSLTALLSQALTALSAWATNVIGSSTITLVKLTSTGSGNAAKQLRVISWLPHTICQ
jgi:hypothetical protein